MPLSNRPRFTTLEMFSAEDLDENLDVSNDANGRIDYITSRIRAAIEMFFARPTKHTGSFHTMLCKELVREIYMVK